MKRVICRIAARESVSVAPATECHSTTMVWPRRQHHGNTAQRSRVTAGTATGRTGDVRPPARIVEIINRIRFTEIRFTRSERGASLITRQSSAVFPCSEHIPQAPPSSISLRKRLLTGS